MVTAWLQMTSLSSLTVTCDRGTWHEELDRPYMEAMDCDIAVKGGGLDAFAAALEEAFAGLMVEELLLDIGSCTFSSLSFSMNLASSGLFCPDVSLLFL